ncbi:MAG TPA: hypothetical protein VMH04_18530 [Candidatus Solibacter sp.]|nr:hypothetical protein [Candidatus Solibacter sp.]
MTPRSAFFARFLAAAILTLIVAMYSRAADLSVRVELNSGKAGPRSVEALTQRSIVRDYKFAWASLAQALESNTTSPLNGLFAGNANELINAEVKNQQRTGLISRYLHQNHNVEVVFYAPEGDMMQLHDTADYDLQLLDGNKTIHQEHVTVRFVVLITPAADRWVIRQLQSVPQF